MATDHPRGERCSDSEKTLNEKVRRLETRDYKTEGEVIRGGAASLALGMWSDERSLAGLRPGLSYLVVIRLQFKCVFISCGRRTMEEDTSAITIG